MDNEKININNVTEDRRNGINRKLSNVDIALIKQQTIKNSSGENVDITKQTILDIAIEYLSMGFSIIPIQFRGKKPVLIPSWKKYQTTLPSQDELAFWFGRNQIINIGLVLGKVSGGIIAVDFDIIDSFNKWENSYTEIAKKTAISKTGKGYHVLFKFNGDLPPNFKPTFNGKEFGDIKSEGGYIVVPPSTHENGHQYIWLRHPKDGIYEINDLSEIGIEKKKSYKEPILEHKLREPDSTAYGIAALDAECEKITSTTKGNRNNQLFISATSVFELVAGNELSLSIAYQRLKNAGLSTGLSEKEVEATLKSAKEHGFKNPRTAPETNKQKEKKQPSSNNVNKPTSQLITKTLEPYSFVEPNGFSVTENAISLLKEKQDQTTERIPIAHSPVLIVAEAFNLDTKMIDIKLVWKKDNTWKETWTSRKTIADSRKILDLSDIGIPVHSRNASNLILYFSEFEALNKDLTLKKTKIERCGWRKINNQDIMVIGENVIQPQTKNSLTDIEVTPPPGFENYIKAFRKDGSFAKWKDAIKLMTKIPIPMFQLYASFLPPFQILMGAPNFIINISGQHSTGKTSSQYPAASVWGFPVREQGGLITGWNATKVGIENIAYFSNNLPVFLDDLQNVDDEIVARVIYMFANGIGKLRGAPRGIRPTFHWQGVLFSNGEKPISTVSNFGGASARVIDIWGKPFNHSNGEFIDELKAILSENYGHAGPDFLIWAWDKMDKQKLRKNYMLKQKELSTSAKTEVAYRVSHYFAAIWTIAEMVDTWLKLPSGLSNMVITNVFDRTIGEQEHEADKPKKAINEVLSWVESNIASFMGSPEFNKSTIKEVYGVYRQAEYVAIYPHKLREFMERHHLGYSETLKAWKDRKWIKTYEEHLTYPISFDNRILKMVCIPFPSISGDLEGKEG